jgi:16S rRNA (cytosine967-C5)-methyltransferase
MNPRQYALNVLEQVVVNHGYANLLLRKQMDFSVQDMGLISEIVYGTLRNYTWLEYQWKHFAKSVRPKTAVLLNMSVYQMLYLDKVPDYAVINEAVEMSSKKDKSFVNAVLRKVQKQQERAVESTDELETAALRFSHPLWLLKLWSAHYGKETALKIAEHDQTRGQVYGRINTLKITKEELQKDERVHFLNDISFTFDGNLTDTDWFRNGQVIIQDIASAMIPEYLEAEPGMRVHHSLRKQLCPLQEEGQLCLGAAGAERRSL